MSIHPTSILTNCTLGENVTIGPFCMLTDCTVGNNVEIEGNVRIEKSTIEENALLLWGSIIRESAIGANCVIGCEVKKSQLGEKNKAKHPGTTIASTRTGKHVNFGGGVKCANYDGTGKGSFLIGDDVFLGCNVVLSVKAEQITTIGKGSKIGASIHISTDIPDDSLVYQDRTTGTVTVREGYYAEKK